MHLLVNCLALDVLPGVSEKTLTHFASKRRWATDQTAFDSYRSHKSPFCPSQTSVGRFTLAWVKGTPGDAGGRTTDKASLIHQNRTSLYFPHWPSLSHCLNFTLSDTRGEHNIRNGEIPYIKKKKKKRIRNTFSDVNPCLLFYGLQSSLLPYTDKHSRGFQD